jgi:hypothetical protein
VERRAERPGGTSTKTLSRRHSRSIITWRRFKNTQNKGDTPENSVARLESCARSPDFDPPVVAIGPDNRRITTKMTGIYFHFHVVFWGEKGHVGLERTAGINK